MVEMVTLVNVDNGVVVVVDKATAAALPEDKWKPPVEVEEPKGKPQRKGR